MSEHAFLPPSGAKIWMVCAAAPTMWQRYPESEDKPDAILGQAAHWVATGMAQPGYVSGFAVGDVTPQGLSVTEEMMQGAEMYQQEVWRACGGITLSHWHVEERVQIPYVAANNWGTPDTWLFGHNPTTGRAKLTVLDYKFGHEYVDVFENWQLIDYACGILDHLGITGLADQMIDVEFVIVQPRCYQAGGPVRTWRVLASDLRARFNLLQSAAARANAPDPMASPTAAGCKHCSGRHACNALQLAGYASADLARKSVPIDLLPGPLGLEAAMLEEALGLLDARVSGLKEQIEHALRAGHAIPLWGMDNVEGRLKWTVPDAEVIALGQMMGASLAKPDVLTPVQAMKKIDPEMVALYSTRAPGGATLVRRDDSAARKVFG